MNIQMTDVMYTACDGRVNHLQRVYIRGSKIRFIVVPDILKFVSIEGSLCFWDPILTPVPLQTCTDVPAQA